MFIGYDSLLFIQTTMKMGIERILKENFPYIKTVEAVSGSSNLSIDMIEKSLAPVAASIKAMNGEVKVDSVNEETGEVVILFRGPARLKQGLQLILKDIKEIKSVTFNELTR